MSKRLEETDVSPTGEPPSEPDEIGPAIRDMTYRLTHDLTDTPEDLRDAAGLAPLAAIKLAQQAADFLAKRPKRTFFALVGLAVIAVRVAVALRKRP